MSFFGGNLPKLYEMGTDLPFLQNRKNLASIKQTKLMQNHVFVATWLLCANRGTSSELWCRGTFGSCDPGPCNPTAFLGLSTPDHENIEQELGKASLTPLTVADINNVTYIVTGGY